MILSQLPPDFVESRDALHQIAFYALSPARYKAVGRMGLRATPGGFGAPEFNGMMARVQGTTLIVESGENIASQTVSTVRNAAQFFGVDYEREWFSDFRDPLPPVDPDQELVVGDPGARVLAEWFGFGFDVLEKLRAQAVASDDASEVQLWPEHFDPAIEMGDQDAGLRASYGASPGDAGHPEPYVYVAAWGEIDRSNDYWNDRAFNGSSLGHAALLASDDPVATALDFLLQGYGILHTG